MTGRRQRDAAKKEAEAEYRSRGADAAESLQKEPSKHPLRNVLSLCRAGPFSRSGNECVGDRTTWRLFMRSVTGRAVPARR